MVRLQKTMKGEYYIQLPRELVRLAGWKEGDEIEVRLGSEVTPGRRDLVLLLK